jgi:hypothetical protein
MKKNPWNVKPRAGIEGALCREEGHNDARAKATVEPEEKTDEPEK